MMMKSKKKQEFLKGFKYLVNNDFLLFGWSKRVS